MSPVQLRTTLLSTIRSGDARTRLDSVLRNTDKRRRRHKYEHVRIEESVCHSTKRTPDVSLRFVDSLSTRPFSSNSHRSLLYYAFIERIEHTSMHFNINLVRSFPFELIRILAPSPSCPYALSLPIFRRKHATQCREGGYSSTLDIAISREAASDRLVKIVPRQPEHVSRGETLLK